MDEYINRAELIENLNKFAPEHYNALINQLITKQPTADVVEVVRCKDCKRCYEKHTKLNNQLMRFCMRMDGNEYQVNANDFCSYGTPKERGGEK